VIALVAAKEYYGARKAVGHSIPASEHSTITSWGTDGELDAMRNMLEQYPEGLVACVSDSFDVFKACREYWGGALKEKIKGRISETSFGQLIVRPDSGDPEETCVAIMKILMEQFAEGVITTATGHKLLPSYIRLIQGDGVDWQSIPKILQRFKDEGFAAANITFGSGGSLLQKLNRDTFKVAFKCSEVVLGNGEAREVFKDPITDDGKASKKGRLTLQLASDITSYALEDIYVSRQGENGTKGGTGYLHFTPDGKYVTVASGKGDPDKDLMVDVFENGELLQDWKFNEIRRRADLHNGPFLSVPEEVEVEVACVEDKAAEEAKTNGALGGHASQVTQPLGSAPTGQPVQQIQRLQPFPTSSAFRSTSVPVSNVPGVILQSPGGAACAAVNRPPSFIAAPLQGQGQAQVQRPSFVAAPPEAVTARGPSFVAAPPGARGPSFVAAPPGAPQSPSRVPAVQSPSRVPAVQSPTAYYPGPGNQPAAMVRSLPQQVHRPSFVAAPPGPGSSARPSFVGQPSAGYAQASPVMMYAPSPALQGSIRPGVITRTPGLGATMPQRSASVGVGMGFGQRVA